MIFCCLFVFTLLCLLFVCVTIHYRSYSERVQKSSYESYDSFRCQKGIKSGQAACPIFIDKEVCQLAIYTVSNNIMHLLLFLVYRYTNVHVYTRCNLLHSVYYGSRAKYSNLHVHICITECSVCLFIGTRISAVDGSG